MDYRAQIVKTAFYSRAFLVVLQYISNHAISDHKADAFRYISTHNSTDFSIMEHLLGGFVRWDAQYFMHIAKFGYTYENTLAFFPLYPVVVGFLGESVVELIGRWYIDSVLILIFIIANIYLFQKAALALYDLTTFALNNCEIAYQSARLFCFNPASVFFVAPYTETLFSYLTFLGMLRALQFFKKYSDPNKVFAKKDLLGLVPIALSTATRSNGLLNICFLLYTFICWYKVSREIWVWQRKSRYFTAAKLVCVMLTSTIFCLLPFLFFQMYSYAKFCKIFPVESLPAEVLQQAKDNEWILPGQHAKYNQSWCNNLVPLAYNYVQKHYWNVGFMQYYEWKQWPNFVLAAPMLGIITFSCLRHIWLHLIKKHKLQIFTLADTKDYYCNKKRHMNVTVFYVHALFLALYSMFFVHIQVSTRLIAAASPVFYWVCSRQFTRWKVRALSPLAERCLMFYFAFYFIVGTVSFCNFFPWT
ncbi:hypothetical protein YQE_10245, partial [Dendroctonus ponderosae]